MGWDHWLAARRANGTSLWKHHPVLAPGAAVVVIVVSIAIVCLAWIEGARSAQECAMLIRKILSLEHTVSETRRMAYDGRPGSDTSLLRGGIACLRSAWQCRGALVWHGWTLRQWMEWDPLLQGSRQIAAAARASCGWYYQTMEPAATARAPIKQREIPSTL